jgi:hypothetical protein
MWPQTSLQFERGEWLVVGTAQFCLAGTSDRSQASRRPRDPVHWAEGPWSVPRLRGRGEQGGS